MNIVFVMRECLCGCGQFVEDCTFQRRMRALGLNDVADAASREIESPPLKEGEPEWTSSDLYRKSS